MAHKELVFSPQLMNKLFEYLAPIYKSETSRIQYALNNYAKNLQKVAQVVKDSYWYKDITMYTTYPDGICYNKNRSPLINLCSHINYIKSLGCNAIHILPFFESPLIDAGFDVSNFYKVRKSLGTMSDLHKIKQECDKEDIQIFIDLVINHVSDQHEWFQKAQKGRTKYRNFFLFSRQKPHFIRKYYQESEVLAVYREADKEVAPHIAFPEVMGDLPHWQQGKDGYWYYHTYYPEQPDLNWFNPDVFINMAKVVMYWSGLGFNFRLDSVPFVGKPTYKTEEGAEITYQIIAALKSLAREINSECIFLVESFESLNTVIGYFGNEGKIQAELSYNFHLNTNTWISLIKKDAFYIWRVLEKQKHIPQHAAWLNFVRNHDELSLAHLSSDLVDDVRNEILKRGKPFREKFGISGRTFSLLGNNRKRFMMAYFLLASLPGGMMLPYGDEIACANIPFKKLSKKEKIETRNINRGKFSAADFQTARSKKIIGCIKEIIANKHRLHNYFAIWPERINAPPEIYAACYDIRDNKLAIYINLSDKTLKIKVDLLKFHPLIRINKARVTKRLRVIELGPYAGAWLLGTTTS